MIYIVPLFLIAIAVYCLQPESANSETIILFGNKVLIWQLYFYTIIFSMLAIAFYELRRKSVLRSLRFVYLCGFILMSLYTLFNILMYLNEPDITKILGIINSYTWSAIFYASILIMLTSMVIYFQYDRSRT